MLRGDDDGSKIQAGLVNITIGLFSHFELEGYEPMLKNVDVCKVPKCIIIKYPNLII